MLLSLFMISSVNATQIFEGVNNAFPTLPNDVWTDRILSKTSSHLEQDSAVFLQNRVLFPETQKTLHTVQILNEMGNSTQNFTLSANYFVGNDLNFNNVQFSLFPGQQKAFAVLTTQDNQELDLFVTCTNGCGNSSGSGYKIVYQLLDKQDRTYSQAIGVFIGFTSDLIEINLNLWRLAFYLIIFIIFIGLIIGILYLIFKFIEFGERLGEKKDKAFYGGRGGKEK